MKAAVIAAPGEINIQDIPKPKWGKGEILIKVEACGVCGSDLRIFRHGNKRVTFPAVLGHEVVGTIVEKGPGVTKFEIGDRVAMGADIPCGKCRFCLAGQCNNCDTNLAIGYQYQGGFAEFIKIDANVWDIGPFQKIPNNMSFDQAAVAEPLACIINGFEILPNVNKDILVIFGAGIMGCLFTEVAPQFGYERIFLVDVKQERLDTARDKGFMANEFLVYTSDIEKILMEKTDGRGADAVIVAAASSEAQVAALKIVGKRGAVNLFAGLPPTAPNQFFPANLIHYNEIFLTGSHGSTPKQYAKAMEFISSGQVKAEKAISQKLPLRDIQKAFEIIEQQKSLKIIIHPNE